jgi:predicted nucleic acid-binding protein
MQPERVYLDANVFIRLFESDDEIASVLADLTRLVPPGAAPPFVTSELTLAEILVGPLAKEDSVQAATYEAAIQSSTAWLVMAVTRPVLRDAAGLRARREALKLPDAVHLATAAIAGCSHLLTGDQDLRRIAAGMRDLGIIVPDVIEPVPETLAALREWLAR